MSLGKWTTRAVLWKSDAFGCLADDWAEPAKHTEIENAKTITACKTFFVGHLIFIRVSINLFVSWHYTTIPEVR